MEWKNLVGQIMLGVIAVVSVIKGVDMNIVWGCIVGITALGGVQIARS